MKFANQFANKLATEYLDGSTPKAGRLSRCYDIHEINAYLFGTEGRHPDTLTIVNGLAHATYAKPVGRALSVTI
jgi:hypothetical protein